MSTTTTTKTTTKTSAKKQATRTTGKDIPATQPRRVRKAKAQQTAVAVPTLDFTKNIIATKCHEASKETAKRTKDQLRILARDLPEGSMGLFKHAMTFRGDWSGAPPTYEVLPAPNSSIKKDEGHLTDLKKRGLVSTHADKQTGYEEIYWITFTPYGEQLVAYLEKLANPDTLIIDGLREAQINTTANKKLSAASTAKPVAASRVPAVKIDRMRVRYEAVSWVMTQVKPDSWTKAAYNPLLKELEAVYAPLYLKLKTPDKRHAYSTGIVNFCLAACRKAGQKP